MPPAFSDISSPPSMQNGRLAAWYFAYFAFIGAFQPYFALYLQELGLPAQRIAWLMALSPAMRLVAPLCGSWFAARIGRRVRAVSVVSATMAAALLCFCGVLATREFWGLALALLSMHFFWSASLPLVEALTLKSLEHRPEDYGRIRLWGSLGFIVTVMGIGWLLDHVGIAIVPWLDAAMILATLLASLALREAPLTPSAHAAEPLAGLYRGKMLALCLASLCMVAAHGALYVFYSIHLVAHGYDKSAIGALWVLGVAAEIAVFLSMPYWSKRVSYRAILLASFALAAVRFVMIGWGAESIVCLLLAQLLHGASFGAHHVATLMMLNRWFSARRQAHAQALYGSVAYGAGGLIGAVLAGELWVRVGSSWTYGAASVLALVGLMLIWRGVEE